MADLIDRTGYSVEACMHRASPVSGQCPEHVYKGLLQLPMDSFTSLRPTREFSVISLRKLHWNWN